MNIRDRAWLPDRDEPADLWEMLNKAWRDLRQYRIATADVEDGAVTLPKLSTVPIASAYCATAQSIATGTVTVVQIDTLDFADASPAHLATTLSSFRMTVTVPGYYRVRVRVGMTAAGAGRIAALIALNGNLAVNESQASAPAVAATAVVVETAPILKLAQGDYVQACAFQNTGAPVALSTSKSQRAQLQVEYVGGL